jgi:hypothetical protein
VPSSLLEEVREQLTEEPAKKRQKITHNREQYLSTLNHLKRIIEYGKGRICQHLILKDLRNYVKVAHNNGETVQLVF